MNSDPSSKLTVSVRAIAAALMLVAAGASVYFVAPASTSASSSGGEDAGRGVLSYRFMRTVDVHNNDTATDRQQVPVGLNTSHEISEGHLASDCRDVRFTLSDDPRVELPYAFNASACGENKTVFWVSVPSIPANQTGPEKQISLFYGESEQEGAPNASQTFVEAETGEQTLCGTLEDHSACDDNDASELVHTATAHDDPVIIAYLATGNELDATSVRVYNVGRSSFVMGMQEPSPSTNADHFETEAAPWLKVPAGDWVFLNTSVPEHNCSFFGDNWLRIRCNSPVVDVDGGVSATKLEAGTVQTGDAHVFSTASFAESFDTRPSVFANLNSFEDKDFRDEDQFLATQAANVGTGGFDVADINACGTGYDGASGGDTTAWLAVEQEEGRTFITGDDPLRHTTAYEFARHAQDGDKDGEPDTWETITDSLADLRVFVEGDTDTGDPFWARGGSSAENEHTFFAHEPDDSCSTSHADSGFSYGLLGETFDGGYRIPLINDTKVESVVGSEVSLLASSDSDGDAVSDTLEETLCGRPVESELVGGTSKTGDCTLEGDDYTPTGDETWLISPSLLNAGEDRDGDGVPTTVNLSYTNATINTTEDDPVDVRFGGTIQEKLDFNDTDPSVPATDKPCTVFEAPRGTTSLHKGPDEDGDAVPQNVWLSRGELCVDTSQENPSVDPSVVQTTPQLDPDDTDASVPSADEITAETVARNATFSPDFDDDHMPCFGYIGYVEVTFNRSTHEYTTETWTNKRNWDPDCSDASVPTDLTLDGDDDLIPDDAEDDACEAQNPDVSLDGSCTDLGTNYHPSENYELTLDPTI